MNSEILQKGEKMKLGDNAKEHPSLMSNHSCDFRFKIPGEDDKTVHVQIERRGTCADVVEDDADCKSFGIATIVKNPYEKGSIKKAFMRLWMERAINDWNAFIKLVEELKNKKIISEEEYSIESEWGKYHIAIKQCMSEMFDLDSDYWKNNTVKINDIPVEDINDIPIKDILEKI